MSTPTPPATNKKNIEPPAPELPPVKDKFLAQLVEILGYEKGVKFYQEGNVTEQELSDLIALAKKFDVLAKIAVRR